MNNIKNDWLELLEEIVEKEENINKEYVKNTLLYNQLEYKDIKIINGSKYIYVLRDGKHYETLSKKIIPMGKLSYYELKNTHKLNKKEFYATLKRKYQLNRSI